MRPPRDPDVASLSRRAAAGTVDGMLLLGAIGAGIGLVVKTRGDSLPSGRAPSTRTIRAVGWGARLVLVAGRGVTTPGERVTGIRRVDARTGGPVSRRSVIVGQAVEYAAVRVTRPLVRRVSAPYEEAQRVAGERLRELPRSHRGDRDALDDEKLRIYREENVSCLPPLLASLASGSLMPLSALVSPRRQTLADRLAGIVVVRHRG